MAASVPIRRPAQVLVDVLPGGLARDIGLVLGAAAFVGVVGNVSIPLPFTPVPLTLGTFAVLLAGAALGPLRAFLSMSTYLIVGAAGLPWFAERTSGWAFPSFGYIVGFVVAATVVGALARRGADRHVVQTAASMALGSLIIYGVGVPWLMLSLGVDAGTAVSLGLTPFLVGDALKALAAALLLPAAWRSIGSPTQNSEDGGKPPSGAT